jgi:dTDP-4-dehydrorhamnose 3,5-epimerase
MNPVTLIRPRRFEDDRGWFMEVYSSRAYAQMGITAEFQQDNHSLSHAAGVVRGLHFQRPPHAQAKLVRCVRGAILDVAVDLRQGSPTFGRHVTAELTADNGHQLFVPEGFGHGFVTLTPDTEVCYKVSGFYAREHDGGIAHDDPDIGIAWPLPAGHEPILSAKDRALPRLRDWTSPFAYDGRPLLPLDD